MLDKLDVPTPLTSVRLTALVNDLSPADLSTLQDMLARSADQLKARKEVFEAVVTKTYGADAIAAYAQKGDDSGTVRLRASNTLDIKADRSKTVVWDQPGLLAYLNSLKPEDAKHLGSFKVSVGEAKYKAAMPDVKKKLEALRTVKVGDTKFTFVSRELEEEAA